jgi:hypothetical protein
MIPFTATREKLLGIFFAVSAYLPKNAKLQLALVAIYPVEPHSDAVANGEFPSGKVA